MLKPVSSGQGDGIEFCARVSHKGRFQDVTTLPVNLEPALVYVHVGTGCLEVQRHWESVETGILSPRPFARSAERRASGLYRVGSRRSTEERGCSWRSPSGSLPDRCGSAFRRCGECTRWLEDTNGNS